ncbi:MAG TPA: helix-turn-helix domain-containing protein [Polyangiales bacterium]|nr:helix-turn-helix domain-containing protein [Polyangiales bacterium]
MGRRVGLDTELHKPERLRVASAELAAALRAGQVEVEIVCALFLTRTCSIYHFRLQMLVCIRCCGSTLNTCSSASLGTSHQQLVDELRRSLAAAELRRGASSIEALAERLGFSNRNAFQRAFRRYTGLSPAQYRDRFRSRPC